MFPVDIGHGLEMQIVVVAVALLMCLFVLPLRF